MAPPGAFTSAAELDVAVVLAGAASTSVTALRRSAGEAGVGLGAAARTGALFCTAGFATVAAGAADPNGTGAAPVDAAVPEVVAGATCFAAGFRLAGARFCAGM